MSNTTFGTKPISEAHDLMMQEVRAYLSPAKPTMKKIHDDVSQAFLRRNSQAAAEGRAPLVPPSRHSVHRAIRSLVPFEVKQARHWETAALKTDHPDAAVFEGQRPGTRVEIYAGNIDIREFLGRSGLCDPKPHGGKREHVTFAATVCSETRMPLRISMKNAVEAGSEPLPAGP